MRSGLRLVLLVAAVARPAAAGELDATLFAGFHVFGASRPTDPDSGPLVGARAAFVLDPASIELEAGLIESHLRDDDDATATSLTYRLSLLVRLVPELGVIAGVGGLTRDGTTRLAAEVGLASQIEVAPSWGVRIDLRAFPGSDLDWEATLGVTWAFSR